ncbi:chemotaxis protein CheX [Heliomicrobium modesticaldum]|nr:chemotaxis protein CheX [Heliomicrobium modesticaldum]
MDQLGEVLNRLKHVRARLGVLAIDAGYMTGEQVEQIHSLQLKQDKRFGELAVQEGFLTVAQLEELLGNQSSSYLALSQVLVDKGFFTYDQMADLLREFKEQRNISDQEFEALKNDDMEAMVDVFLKLNQSEENRLYRDAFLSFVKNTFRFVESNFRFSQGEVVEQVAFKRLVFTTMNGSYDLFMGLAGEQDVIEQFALRFSEGLGIDDIEMQDSLGEFLNVTCGLFLASLSNQGIDLELQPPTLCQEKALLRGQTLFRIPVHLPFGRIDFIFAEGIPAIAG